MYLSSPSRLLKCLAVGLTLLSLAPMLQGQTEVSGLVFGRWTIQNSPYLVVNDATIGADQSLEIDAGVVVQFRDADDDLWIDGTLNVNGSAAAPVTFTSNDATKSPGQWGAIIFRRGSDASTISHANVEFGGGFRAEQLRIENASPTLQSVILRSSLSAGLGVFGGDPSLSDTHFVANGGFAATLGPGAFPSLSNSTAADNQQNAIGRHGGSLPRSGIWARDQIPYTILNDITIPQDISLTIEPGTTVQFRDADDDLWVDGTLTAKAIDTSPIRFTSDDMEKTPGHWGALIIRATSKNTILQHCIIEYGGGFRNEQLRIENAAPLLENLQSHWSRDSGLALVGGQATIRNATFTDNAGYATTATVTAFPIISGLKASGNGSNSIGRHGGTLTQSGTWQQGDIPYTILNDITIAPGAKLNIAPGTTVQFRDPDDDLWVDGVLIAIGETGKPIRFTTDNVEAAPGQWGAVLLRNQGEQARSEFVLCTFTYGGGFRTGMLHCHASHPLVQACTFQFGQVRGIELANASPEIQSTAFLNNNDYAMSLDSHSFPLLRDNRAEENGANSIAVLGGTITKHGTWEAETVPFTITTDLTISPEGKLTIIPGSRIQFQDADDDLWVDGALVARGTPDKVIQFTSDEQEKAPAQWGAILIRDSADDSTTIFDHCLIEFGGGFRNENLWVTDASPTIANSHIRGSRDRGLTLIGSESIVDTTHFSENQGYAIGINNASFPRWNKITANDNGADSIAAFGGALSATGTWHSSDVPYTILNDLTITQEAQLTIAPGNHIQFQDTDDDLWVDGTLIASGTADLPIRFTSNNNEKAPGQWGALLFRDTSNDSASKLESTIIEYGGGFRSGALELTDAAPPLSNIEIHHSHAHGLVIRGSNPFIEHATFRDNTQSGIHTSLGASPAIQQSLFSNNGGHGITNGDTSVIVNATNNYWGDPTGPLDTSNDDNLDQTNPEGQGDSVSEFVRWQPFSNAPTTEPQQPEPPSIPTAEIAINPESIDFGQRRVNESIGIDLILRNTGSIALTIDDARATPPFEGFLPSFPLTIPPDSTATVTAIFRPIAPGNFNGSISFGSNASNSPQLAVPLSGSAIELVVPFPIINSVTPNRGSAGTEVVIEGSNFAPAFNDNAVLLGSFTATLIRTSETEIVAIIPDGLPAGPIELSVEADGRQSASTSFEVIASLPASPPFLEIQPSADGRVEISWSGDASGFQLESTDTLTPGIRWTAADGTPNLISGRFVQSVDPVAARRFFRLSHDAAVESQTPTVLRLPDSWTPEYPIVDSKEQVIPASSGGTVQLANGATVTLPAGALTEDTPLRLAQRDLSQTSADLKRDIYEIDMGDTVLLKPAVFEFPYKHLNPEGNIVVYRADPEAFPEELTVELDNAQSVARITTHQFSIFDVEDASSYGGIFFATLNDPSRSKVLDVPYYSQEESQWCFAASSQMMLKNQNIDIEPWHVAQYFDAPVDEGAAMWQLYAGHYRSMFSSFGAATSNTLGGYHSWLAPLNLNGYLIEQINAGRPVFVIIRYAVHAIVVVGYSQAGVFIHDPSGAAIEFGTGTKPPENQRSRRFLNWDQWGKAISFWPSAFVPVALPAWTIVLPNVPVNPPPLLTFGLPTATDSGTAISGGGLTIERVLPSPTGRGIGGIVDSAFFWNGTKPAGYEFVPGKGFAPPTTLSNTDRILLKFNLHNASRNSAAASIRLTLAGREIYNSPQPIVVPAATNSQQANVFEVRSEFNFADIPDGLLRPGTHTFKAELHNNGQLTDTLSLELPIGPSRPTGLTKEQVSEGVRLKWEPVPESATYPTEYEVSDGFRTRLAIPGRNHLIPTTEGGNIGFNYRVVARDRTTGLKSPPSLPAVLKKGVTYSIVEGPVVEGGDKIMAGQATALVGSNIQTVTWTAPPPRLEPGEEFTIDLNGETSGPPSFKYATTGSFRGLSSPPGLAPGRISASATYNPVAPTLGTLPSGSARAGYYSLLPTECPVDPQTLMFCFEPSQSNHTETFKAPAERDEFYIVIRIGGFDSESSVYGGQVYWKYAADD